MRFEHCEEVQQELARNEIAPAMRDAVQAHLAGCQACRSVQALYARMDESLKRSFVWEPPKGFAANVASRVAREAPRMPERPRIETWDIVYAVVLGALVVATLYLGSRLFVQTATAAATLTAAGMTRVVWVCAIAFLCVSAWFTRRAFR